MWRWIVTEEFDYVIVGGGTAGAVVARRLAEKGNFRVCLIEAGPADRNVNIHFPAGFINMLGNKQYTWQLETADNPRTGVRPVAIPQGKTLGGSSSINGMVYVRGLPSDFDGWERAGNPGWSYADVLPYFKVSEDWQGANSNVRGQGGPLQVRNVRWDDALTRAFNAAAQTVGLPENDDYNDGAQEGYGVYQQMATGHRRASAAQAFLRPVRRLPNLHIRTETMVVRVVVSGGRAIGVNCRRGAGGAEEFIGARKEVVLAAGAANTPKLLQISGLGPAKLLKSIGVEVVADIPGVGENLQDHYCCRSAVRVRNTRSMNETSRMPLLGLEMIKWLAGRQSILSISPSIIAFFARSGLSKDIDLQGAFLPASYAGGPTRSLEAKSGMTLTVWQHRPESVGYLHARTADACDTPVVQPNYLDAEIDQQVIVSGIRLMRKLTSAPSFRPFFEQELSPGIDLQSDDELLDYARRTGSTVYHLCGTAKMGPKSDPMAVVDHQLRMHAVDGLRVVDASIMPKLVSGNTCAATIMIGERGADFIKATQEWGS